MACSFVHKYYIPKVYLLYYNMFVSEYILRAKILLSVLRDLTDNNNAHYRLLELNSTLELNCKPKYSNYSL